MGYLAALFGEIIFPIIKVVLGCAVVVCLGGYIGVMIFGESIFALIFTVVFIIVVVWLIS